MFYIEGADQPSRIGVGRVVPSGARVGPADPLKNVLTFGESGLLENEPTVPAEQAHTAARQ